MPYVERMYGVVIVRPGADMRLFARVRRNFKGEVFVLWDEDQSPNNLAKGSNAHASYHKNGRIHSKAHDQPTAIRGLQLPGNGFRGNQPIEITNANRALSPTLRTVTGRFDDEFQIPLSLITGRSDQHIVVHLVEPGIPPGIATGGKDGLAETVLAEKIFKEEEPWIVVRLVESVHL
jgi:hypothetical protein